MSTNFLSYLLLLVALMSLAALFVYRPEKFKALPWVVLAVMGLAFFIATWNSYGNAVLWGYNWNHVIVTNDPERIINGFCWIGKANLGFVYYFAHIVVSAIPILALWVMLIVGAVQKKKKAS